MIEIKNIKKAIRILIIFLLSSNMYFAQSLDNFESTKIKEWEYFSGDGNIDMDFHIKNGIAKIKIDAAKDIHNAWWALVKKNISAGIDLTLLEKDDYELRIEAKVKVSTAPRRINLHVNTQRTTDFHSHLMEYEIPDNKNWHIIRMTTHRFNAVPGDSVSAQLALMDWGMGEFWVELDYFKADVVKKNATQNFLGNALVYHPPIPSPSTFNTHLLQSDAAVISSKYVEENFNDWNNLSVGNEVRCLTLSSDQLIIINWDFSQFNEYRIEGNGLLEISVASYQTGKFSLEELGQIRLVEIIGGKKNWTKETVTYKNFMGINNPKEIFNMQPVYDLDLKSQKGNKKYFTVNRYVMNRLMSGESHGLALKALGPIVATLTFKGEEVIKLNFNKIKK